MALLGPAGFREVGELILDRSHRAAERLAGIAGVSVPETGGFFKEFPVSYDRADFASVDAALRARNILGGIDVGKLCPELPSAALYAFTEIHDDASVDALGVALQEILA